MKIKTQRRAKKRERAGKRTRADAVFLAAQPLRKPEGQLAMLLSEMKRAELEAQVQAETATKLRQQIVTLLKSRRLAGNIPLEVIAAAIGRNRVTMVRLERLTTVAKDSTLSKMLHFFGVDWQPTAKVFTSEAKIQKRRAE